LEELVGYAVGLTEGLELGAELEVGDVDMLGANVGAVVVVGPVVAVGEVVLVGLALGSKLTVGYAVGLHVGSNAGKQTNFSPAPLSSQHVLIAHFSKLSSNE